MRFSEFFLFVFFTGITKKLKKLSGAKVGNKQAGRWVPAIVSHMYKVVQDTPPQLAWDRLVEIRSQPCLQRSRARQRCFPACSHDQLVERKVVDEVVYVRDWIDPGMIHLFLCLVRFRTRLEMIAKCACFWLRNVDFYKSCNFTR